MLVVAFLFYFSELLCVRLYSEYHCWTFPFEYSGRPLIGNGTLSSWALICVCFSQLTSISLPMILLPRFRPRIDNHGFYCTVVLNIYILSTCLKRPRWPLTDCLSCCFSHDLPLHYGLRLGVSRRFSSRVRQRVDMDLCPFSFLACELVKTQPFPACLDNGLLLP